MSFFKKLFGLDEVAPHDTQHTALLTTVESREDQMALEALLRGAGIPYECRERGVGSPLKIIAGYSFYGTDVFVRKDMLETAQELLAVMSAPAEDENASPEDADTHAEGGDASAECGENAPGEPNTPEN